MFNILKRIIFLPFLALPSLTQAEEIRPEFFLHDFLNATILYVGMENGCGTVDEKMYRFIVRGSGDYLMYEQGWDVEEAKSFLKAAALQVSQTATAYINTNGCDRFNFLVIEKKDDYKVLKDVFEIYSFDAPEKNGDTIQL